MNSSLFPKMSGDIVTKHVFISYSRSDCSYIERLTNYLAASSIPVWYDHEIETGEPFGQKVQEAIDNCFALIIVLTPNSVISNWVRRELSRAFRKGIPICPLELEACDVPIELDGVQKEDVTNQGMPPPRFLARLRYLAIAAG
jgi:hypothetical protein